MITKSFFGRSIRNRFKLVFFAYASALCCVCFGRYYSAEYAGQSGSSMSAAAEWKRSTANDGQITKMEAVLMNSQPVRSLTEERQNLSNLHIEQVEAASSPSKLSRETRPNDQICYVYKNGECDLSNCPENSRATHFRGLLKELPLLADDDNVTNGRRPPPDAPPRTRGNCEACKVYSRHCTVSKAHRFIYIHVMKNAGSSIHQFLQSTLCDSVMHGEFNCSSPSLEFAECDRALQDYPDFFKWSLVRHPVLRAISAWSMASMAIEAGGAPVGFNDWAEDPSRLKTQAWEMHWWPQTQFLMDQGHCPIYDYVGVIGPDLARHMELVLTKIDSPVLWERYRTWGFPHDFRSDDEIRRTALTNMSEVAARALLERYQDDFELFGFDLADVHDGKYF